MGLLRETRVLFQDDLQAAIAVSHGCTLINSMPREADRAVEVSSEGLTSHQTIFVVSQRFSMAFDHHRVLGDADRDVLTRHAWHVYIDTVAVITFDDVRVQVVLLLPVADLPITHRRSVVHDVERIKQR